MSAIPIYWDEVEWWRWGELNPRPGLVDVAIIHKISQLIVLLRIVADDKPQQSAYKVRIQQVNQLLNIYSLMN